MSISTHSRIEGTAPLRPEPYYPESAGRPIAETDEHLDQAVYVRGALKIRYRANPRVYVAANNLLYYEEGNPKRCVSPDVYVVMGASNKLRRTYKVWAEGGLVPNVVFEFTSRKTRREDTGDKLVLYRDLLKIPEVFLFDVCGEYLRPPLQGFRWESGTYRSLETVNGRMHSEELGLDLVHDGNRIWLYDSTTGQRLLTAEEYEERARIESEARRRADRAALAETEARLRAERMAMIEADARLQAEQRAASAEDELRKLRAMLRQPE